MTILCAARYRIRGFVLLPSTRMASMVGCAARSCCPLMSNSNIYDESMSVPTVINPTSKRRIHLGGPKYTQLIGEGGWVQHQGSLQRIDMEMLARHQQEPDFRDKVTIPPFQEHSNTEDKWYCITPVVLRTAQASPNTETKTGTMEPMMAGEKIREKLQNELLFVNKPSHLNCVPSRSLSDSLATQVLSSHPGSKPCHRLDRDTSGIVLFGLTKDAHRGISMQFEARTTSKMYVALVAGRPEKDRGIVNLPIGKQKTKEGFNRWTIGGEKPREAITKWSVDHVFTDDETGAVFTRVKLNPLTGRGHQLRLHMKAIGCPILGDTIHAEGGEAMCVSRLCLHAQKLQVDWNELRLEAESIPPF
eukprot:CAMPEP_0197273212 /NCGR_PEP_ID=MMETSP1432-20130617/10960_1 /TAXON_ID=44447 /ORGANISM="Pseudo-nitzschia delicatissima, Strain UNC1205" /LENGTH=360 /DNA_ID=CAMNT_0042738855 /DNA_START=22 /DNA_END=1104 /DNA_ORIENTATION=-